MLVSDQHLPINVETLGRVDAPYLVFVVHAEHLYFAWTDINDLFASTVQTVLVGKYFDLGRALVLAIADHPHVENLFFFKLLVLQEQRILCISVDIHVNQLVRPDFLDSLHLDVFNCLLL